MTFLRESARAKDSGPDGPGLAAACLGALLLCGTALSGLDIAGPHGPTVSAPPATSERDTGDREAAGRWSALGPAPTRKRVETVSDSRRRAAPQALDLNRADATELQALPGIGPTLGRRIVADREINGPFRRPEELLRVPGVGAKRYARLEGLIRTADAP